MSSVRKKDQSEHRFTTLDIILDMYSHTCTVISNPKFNECPDIKRRIEHEAAMIYHLCRAANEDYDNRIIDNLLHRLNVWYEGLWEGEKPDELSEDREEKNDVA